MSPVDIAAALEQIIPEVDGYQPQGWAYAAAAVLAEHRDTILAALRAATSDEAVKRALEARAEADSEPLQYVLIRGLSAIGYAQPSAASWDIMHAALRAARSLP
jgi:hypothetical protein